ncbi:MAG: GTPase ObgE [Candidatus Liptonbacteria bacterium CG11_big_fil_rev_8_21_14_0_20_35_14]|uniref:GTPase Obg n=1 Tax=Candidatus Liptonbacteria bacterium CG11_big_fil_rev_8_21_14_0_20_35_14 TaxID=1974634 RepID=A0A2H0N949_9BACT|nr:MAG: GTPase ObgE [Candidatus Liptonbacteria bacterium CG11_big_fil_rev_8_21_14_0_20_35_14]
MLVDEIIINVKAGAGGKGAVAFNKNVMSLGPTGGSGGRGGSVYIEGVADIGALNKLKFKKDFEAQAGQYGKSQFNDGYDGQDIVIKVPTGTVIINQETKEPKEIIKIGEKILVAKGGNGGRGNFHFRSSTNTTPKQFQPGLPGEQFTLKLELKLIADVGLVGLPNVGKSSLLNELTNANSKVANYEFTTLEPHLGAYYEILIADIPGIIEGANHGRGLGLKFLKHIERTKIIFHLISAESSSPVTDYKTIRKELETYNPEFKAKPEYIFLSKSDGVDKATLKKRLEALKKYNKNIKALSILDEKSLEDVKVILNNIINLKKK